MSLKASEKARISKNNKDIGNDLEKQALSDQHMNIEGSIRANGETTSRKKSNYVSGPYCKAFILITIILILIGIGMSIAFGITWQSCECKFPGSRSSLCSKDGECLCEDFFTGERCDKCALEGYIYPKCGDSLFL